MAICKTTMALSEKIKTEDLVHAVGESAALGTAGIILWGGYEYSDSKETCLSVQKFIQGPLDRYAVNVTTAAKLCKVYVIIMEDVFEKHLNPPPICICLKVAVRNMP
ncbi:hyaluronidase-like isoform X1 [Tursiops truncatus]|uniref:Hyaluronidase n=2 Tax=Tursiops truncatus TaxID=9739 RepID=A0A2U4AGY8_TURTR|nr:hyaluronidase-like [Tursiops truncatus]